MKLNGNILDAIRKAIDYYGNTSQFAKKVGISHSTILFWLNGKTTNISGSIWDKKLRRKLRPFMTEPEPPPKPIAVHDPQTKYGSGAKGEPVQQFGKKIPALPFSQMDHLDITLQSPVSFVRSEMEAEAVFANPVTDYSFALLLDKAEYCPALPLGTPVLITGEDYAEPGDIVVARTRHPARLCFARYDRDGSRTRLIPLNPKLSPMEWDNHENAEKVFWLFPVREIAIDLGSFQWIGSSLVPRVRR
ncbi:MAG: hypothetical protein J5806_05905 [Lentisphaeria bacterium]|nr:hypothetical protein [Lentisphaeria bacterium]